MKNYKALFVPALQVIIGFFLVLSHLNNLNSATPMVVVLGIIAIAIGLFYIFRAVVSILLIGKFPKKATEIFREVALVAFPFYVAFEFLTVMVVANANLGIGGWVVCVTGLGVSIAFIGLHLFNFFKPYKLLEKIVLIAAVFFVLTLALNVLFDADGDTRSLGGINLVETAIYVCYAVLLFNAVSDLIPADPFPKKPEPEVSGEEEAPKTVPAQDKPEQPKKKPSKKAAKPEEPAPAEEAPQTALDSTPSENE